MEVVVPIWQIYSYWVFAMTLLWLSGKLPFSPLFSAVLSLAASITLSINAPVYLFILFIHALTVWVLRNTSLEVIPNAMVFLVYNLTLLMQSTNFKKVYENIFRDPPRTIQEYLQRRGLVRAFP
jgi:hypothetical protein